jgi:hypothetical protein
MNCCAYTNEVLCIEGYRCTYKFHLNNYFVLRSFLNMAIQNFEVLLGQTLSYIA